MIGVCHDWPFKSDLVTALFQGNYFCFFFSLNGGNPSTDYERRRGSSGTAIGGNSSNAHMRTAASVDRLNLMGEGNTGRKLPSMPDSMQRSPVKISGREGEIAALKRSNRRSASSHNLINSTEGKKSSLFHQQAGLYLGFIIWKRSPKWHEFPRRVRGTLPPPQKFMTSNEYALRCNLVHFETQF